MMIAVEQGFYITCFGPLTVLMDAVFPHRNAYSSQPYVSREHRRLCLGSAQAKLIISSGLECGLMYLLD
jgi:hypothetical protein